MANLDTKTISAGVGDILAIDGGVDATTFRQIKSGDGDISPLWITQKKVVSKSATDIARTFEVQDNSGNPILSVDSVTNKVGIGDASPAHLLSIQTSGTDVQGGISINAGGLDYRFINMMVAENDNNINSIFWDDSDHLAFGDAGIDTASAPATTHMTILSGGNVGIGTASPDTNLEVTSASADSELTVTTYHNSATINSVLTLRTADGSGEGSEGEIEAGDFLGVIRFNGYDNDSWVEGAQIRVLAEETWDANSAGTHMSFHTVDSGVNSQTLDERMRIDHNGNVGIGDASPDALLCLNQGATDTSILTFKSSDVTHGMTDLLETDSYCRFLKIADDYGGLKIDAFAETGQTSSIIIEGNGVDDDGTRSTSARGNIELRSYAKSSATHTAMAGDQNMVVISNATTARYIFDSDGSAHADIEWVAFSDSRLKTSVEDIPYGLAEVLQLQPKRFDKQSGYFDDSGNIILEDNKRKMIGFMAQDIKALIPEMVKDIDENQSFYAMDDGKLIAVLVKAVQELSVKVTALENA